MTWLAAILLAAASIEADHEILKIVTEGSATGPAIEAEARAIERARDAVLFQVLEPYAPTGDYTPFQKVIDRAQDYIYSTRVTKSARNENTSNIELESLVLGRRLKNDIAAVVIPSMSEPPAFLVLIAETIADSPSDVSKPNASEIAIADVLRKAKMTIADTARVRSVYANDELLQQIRMGEEGPAFTVDDGSEVAIVGENVVTIDAPKPPSNLHKATSRLSLRVYELRSLDLVDVLAAEASVQGAAPQDAAEQAIRDACTRIGNDALNTGVLAALSRAPRDAYELVTLGLADESQYQALATSLESFPGIAKLTPSHHSRIASRITFHYTGNLDRLIDHLALTSFPGFKLEPHMILGKELVFQKIEAAR